MLVCLLISSSVYAKEGMWIPSLLNALNEPDMKTMGMKLSAEDVYSINHSSLKDAIVHFNGGCTAEVISKDGLILTNHHCGYSAIQSHSSLENNYLKNGFWAMDRSQELSNPNMTCTFIIKIEEVTEELLSSIEGITDQAKRDKAYADKYKEITDRETKDGHYEAVIKPFNYGNAYFVIVTETFKDIRLVGAPPSSIGKFGGDTDNWVWPRHTGDFSIFRIYAGKDNKPAAFSTDNVPFNPRHSLPVSLESLNEGDFTMVYGFPGHTDQYLLSSDVDYRINKELPRRIDIRESSLNVINAAMRKDESLYIKYASKQARIANAWKKWIGQIGGLKNFNALQKKQDLEKEYLSRSAQKPEYTKYANAVKEINTLYTAYHPVKYNVYNFLEFYRYSGPEIIRFTERFNKMINDTADVKDLKAKHADKLVTSIRGFYKNYNVEVDKQIFKNVLKIFSEDADMGYLPESIRSKVKADPEGYVDDLFEKSVFVDSSATIAMIQGFGKKSVKTIKKDPIYLLMKEMSAYFSDILLPEMRKFMPEENRLMKTYVAGLMEMFPDKSYWYDANSTLRITYGKVEGSSPRDGMAYTYYTTMDGVLDKYDPENPDFELPERLIELGKNRDYGQYAQDGELFVCFTGSNHTTGGNSGSPCISAEGHLIGLNFDRSWESTMSDIMFDPNICRNIMVDIRYVLFIVDKFAGATHLIDEMELVTPEWREARRKELLMDQVRIVTEEIKASPTDVKLLAERSNLYDSLGMQAEADNDIEAAMKLDRFDPDVALAKSNQLVKTGAFGEAISVLSASITKHKDERLYFARGLVYVEMKAYKKGITDFTYVIGEHGTHFKAYYNRGVCYHLTGEPEKGCADFEVAQKLGDNKEFWIYQSTCY